MAAVPIPGSYPDSVPPTPDDSMQYAAPAPAPAPEHHGSHRQRNKLHKAGDPRATHKYTDSGVGGVADPDLIQPHSSRLGASTWAGPDKAVGGGTYARDEPRHVQPLESVTSGLDSTSLSQDFENDPRIRDASDQAWYSSDPARMSQAGSYGGLADAGGFDRQQPSTEWGQEPSSVGRYHQGADFTQPTAAGYDQHSSTGYTHQAPADWSQEPSMGFEQQAPVDYSQQPHAGLEQVSGDITQQPPHREASPYWGSLPKGAVGGIHNSVTGHGSASDDHAEHHHLPPKSASSERAILGGSVANYPRGAGVYNTVVGHGSQDDESRRHNQPHGTDGSSAAVAGAAPLPEIPEEKQRGAASQGHETAPGFLPETSVRDDVLLAEAAQRAPGGSQPRQRSSETSQRAFPLAPSGASTQDDQRGSTEHKAAAGAAGLGAGIAASEYAERHKRRDSPTGNSPTQASAGAVTGKRQPSRQRSPALEQSSSVGNESPKGEKKHKILGIFHRHKDDKEDKVHRRKSSVDRDDVAAANSSARLRKQSRGASTERKRLSSAAEPEDVEHPSHNKEKAAAGAAAGAGAYGLLHHRKKDSISEPRAAAPNEAGPAGEAPREIQEVSTPFEHPRDAPAPPAGAGEPGHYNLLASGTPSGVQHAAAAPSATKGTTTVEPGNYNTLASGTPSGISAATAAVPSRKEFAANEPADYNVMQSSGPSQDERRRSGAAVTQEPGNYNILASGIPSGIKRDSAIAPGSADYNAGSADYNVLESSGPSQAERRRSSAAAAQQPGNYNTLASGVPSGIKQASSERNTAAGTFQNDLEGENGAEYNVLPSGTPSGVKVKPRSPRRSRHESDPVTHAQDQSGQGQYNTLACGTASGVITDDAKVTSRPDAMREFPAPAPAESAITASLPVHAQQQRQQHDPSQESLPGVTTYPHPEMVHNMSPEVMPAAYAASAPRQTSQQGQQQQQQPREQGMSPEVMPDAYTSSAPRQASPLRAQQSQTQQPPEHGLSPEVIPSAYAASAPRHAHQGQQTQQQQPREQGMSPEVIPAAYAASAPRASLPRAQHQTQTQQPQYQAQQQQPQQQQQPPIRDPALAAATTSWATTAGKSSGAGNGVGNNNNSGSNSNYSGSNYSGSNGNFGSNNNNGLLGQAPGQGRLVHRCQHCGGENDISGYFAQFGPGNGGGGAGGNGLWQRRS